MASTASFSIYLSNDGSGTYTPSVRRNPTTTPAGGTVVTIPWTENNNSGSSTTTLLPGVAIQAALRAIVNNISDGF